MASINVTCLNASGLGATWKQACFLNDVGAHSIDVMVTTETKQNNLQAFSQLLKDYEKITFPSQLGGRGGVVVLYRKIWL